MQRFLRCLKMHLRWIMRRCASFREDASKQYGEDFYCAPGSEYIEGSDPWNGTWNVKQWTKEQEAYYVVYKQQLDEKRFIRQPFRG